MNSYAYSSDEGKMILKKKRVLYAVTAAVATIIIIFPAVISNIPASYTLASALNIQVLCD